MSISTAFANALSGLNASARAAQVTSSNVANAMTEGYARRELVVSSVSLGGTGGGVRVVGVARQVNQGVLADRRLADATLGKETVRRDFLQRVETAIGTPEDAGSMTATISDLDAALIAAASRPDSEARLRAVADAAKSVADRLRSASAAVQAARAEADRAIARDVADLNTDLALVDRLNTDILAFRSAGQDTTALMDQRQAAVDRIARIVPVRELQGENDQIALYTTGGALLLEGRPVAIGFTPAGVVSADMTVASGALSVVSVGGLAAGGPDGGVLRGGTLGAHLEVRDRLAPALQSQLDALARDLIERFEEPAVDPTRLAGDPGLFTDAGVAFDPLAETGLAARIAVNGAVLPEMGGALWRLRDGLGSAAPLDAGNAAGLNALSDALGAARIPASGSFLRAARSAAGLASDLLSQVAGARQEGENLQTQAGARHATLSLLLMEDGVDTDAEMQTLLSVEQAYAANARVLKTLDDLLQLLMGI